MKDFTVEFVKNPDGTCTLPQDKLDELVNLNNEMYADIHLAVNNIKKLLLDVDVINKKTGEFQQPSVGRITGFLTSQLMGGGKGFDYLIALKPMLLKYAELVVNEPQL